MRSQWPSSISPQTHTRHDNRQTADIDASDAAGEGGEEDHAPEVQTEEETAERGEEETARDEEEEMCE